MMATDERKLAASPLIPLEIEPASILSLSKGVIFDTIVHNIEYTLSNRRTDPLPWKLSGMSLICDPSRNKKYMQKLQKMQCVPSVICTQIYHSKLVKTESGILATPGRKIIIPTSIRKRLTGIIVCRSIDELLYMEPSNTENVHFIQYKLLSYERIATRELVNGPKLPSVGDKIIKTVFDFELTQNNGFPRQLLPVAIISFVRQDGGDLCSSIQNFLKLDEHQTFDKSYLVTSTNSELDRLREEQEQKEDAEAEQELPWEKIQRRQPLAELSKKSTDTDNSRPQPSQRVPPLKIKLSRSEKPLKSTVSVPPLDSKFQCLLKLNRVNLSLYDICNLSSFTQIKTKKANESSTSINNKTKSLIITKPHEHQKPLKRLNNSETKKRSSPSSETFNKHQNGESISSRSSTSDMATLSTKDKTKQRSASSSSMSPIYRPPSLIRKKPVEKTVIKRKVKRPVLPSEYHCSISLSRIDLSMYDIDLPAVKTSVDNLPMNIESTMTTSPSSSSSSSSEQQTELSNIPVEPNNIQDTIQPMLVVEEENIIESEIQNIFDVQQFDDINTNEPFSNIIDEFLTPEINESLSATNNEVLSPSTDEILLQPTDKSLRTITDEVSSIPTNETLPQLITEIIPMATDEVLPEVSNEVLLETTSDTLLPHTNEILLPATNEIVPVISNEDYMQQISPISCADFSPELPLLDDDPVFFSIESPPIPEAYTSETGPQDYIIIVPCSDDEDDFDDEVMHDHKNLTISNDPDHKTIESLSSPNKINASPRSHNPLLTRIFPNVNHLDSDRLSISSSSSSCSSISTSILHNQSPRSPLHLTEIFISQKIVNKQHKSSQPIIFNRFNISIPLLAHEPLIDPRLIYRLQAITTDLRWPSTCNQCSISAHLSPLFTSSTQMISYDRKCSSDYVDPRRESLKNAVLHSIYQRIKILIPNIFIVNSNQFQKLLFEQTIFKTNCSLHLEYLLHKLKLIDDMNFFHMIKTNDEFQLSPFLLQLIFN